MMENPLELLTNAARYVENQERLLQESLTPSLEDNNNINKPVNHNSTSKAHHGEIRAKEEANQRNSESYDHARREFWKLHSDEIRQKSPDSSNLANKTGNSSARQDEIKTHTERTHSVITQSTSENSKNQPPSYHYNKVVEHTNGVSSPHLPNEDRLTPRYLSSPSLTSRQSERNISSPTVDRGGDKLPATKPMVLLQPPSAANHSAVGTSLPTLGTHPSTAMNPQFLYSMMYPSVSAIDPALSVLNRGLGVAPNEGDLSPHNGSPNSHIPAATAPMHLPAGLMYPFANQALMMGARTATGLDMTPYLLAQSTAAYAGTAGLSPHLQTLEQYKRMMEGTPSYPAYPLQQQLTAQYIKSLMPHGMEGVGCAKDNMSIPGMAGRPAISLAGQSAPSELWLRYPEHIVNAGGVIRPAGMSPRSMSPYASNKRRSESPALQNGEKPSTSAYFHNSPSQPLNSLSGSQIHPRSSSSAVYQQNLKSRSPHPDMRRPDSDRSGYRSHSRDDDRDMKTVMSAGQARSTSEQQQLANEKLNEENARKLAIPPIYSFQLGYSQGLHIPPTHDHNRSPSPQSRASDDLRAYRRTSRERSPGGDQLPSKRRSLDNQHLVTSRPSPTVNDRHNTRSGSPSSNGLVPSATRHQFPLPNGSADAVSELVKANPYLLLPVNHRGSPNPGMYRDGTDPSNGSPANNPYLVGNLPPYFGQHLGGLPAHFLLPHYANALAASGKSSEIPSLYKQGENGTEYSRLPTLPAFGVQAFPLPQQLLASSGRHSTSFQEYALKANQYLTAQSQMAKETGKASPISRDKQHPSLHPNFQPRQPAPSLSPSNQGIKPSKHHSSSPMSGYLKGGSHHGRLSESHSPSPSNANLNNNVKSSSDGRRYISPQTTAPLSERQIREPSPKLPEKHYRPNPMLHHHAEDLNEHRARKLKRKLEEEIAIGEDASSFLHDKTPVQHPRGTHKEKNPSMKDPKKDHIKRRKQTSEEDSALEEHFRRSLGKDYKVPDTQNKVSITGSVDDHFKKALGGDIWNKLQTTTNASIPVKNESRDAIPPNHVLPSYSSAIASNMSSLQNSILSRDYHYAENPTLRDRFHVQSNGVSSNHRIGKSQAQPRSGSAPGSTVLYPTPTQTSVPIRQRIKAKGVVFPESATTNQDPSGTSRTSSASSKASTRTISGSSSEGLPIPQNKHSPTDPTRMASPASSIPAFVRAPQGMLAAAAGQSSASQSFTPSSTVSVTSSMTPCRSPAGSSGTASSVRQSSPEMNLPPESSSELPPANDSRGVNGKESAEIIDRN